MAGIKLELLKKDELEAAITRAIAVMDGEQSLLLDDIGNHLVNSTRARAEREISPDGMPWAALSPRYKKRKAATHPGRGLLHLNKEMLGSRFSHQVYGSELFVGTHAEYGAAQHFGHNGIPSREWLGLSNEDNDEILAIAHDHLNKAFSG